jgi:hypothetical protein
MATWIMTADRAGARIFERDGLELTMVKQIFLHTNTLPPSLPARLRISCVMEE